MENENDTFRIGHVWIRGGNIQTHIQTLSHKHSLVKCGPTSLISFGSQEACVATVSHQSHLLAKA